MVVNPQQFTVVLGVTGSIAAYKAADLVRKLRALRDPAQPGRRLVVRVILTAHGAQFITPVTLQTLSGNAVYQDLFVGAGEWNVEHIGLADDADLLLIAPATANILAKMAGGLADDLLSSVALACTAPVLIAPAMNVHMWEHPATQANSRLLTERGVIFIGPEEGALACGYTGRGRMSAVEAITARVEEYFLAPPLSSSPSLPPPCDLAGRRVLVTAGPTREYLDPVRFISNPSSGKMGYALAYAAARRGAVVTVVSGPVALEAPEGVDLQRVTTTAEMAEITLQAAATADIVIGAAAPCDFTPAECAPQKLKKQGRAQETLQLLPTTDILAAVGAAKQPGQVVVAFAAETEQLEAYAREKLIRKHADLIVANDVSAADAGFAVDQNRAVLLFADGRREELPLQSKQAMADRILDAAVSLL